MPKPRIVCVVGTRPEAIKVAPVVRELRRFDGDVETILVSTGQHREILLQALQTFGLAPDHDLAIMQHGQTLAQVTCRALEGLDRLIAETEPAFVVGQGDTTTTLAAALAAFYRQVPFAHVEAGLRTDTLRLPFPEEFNRRVAGVIADLHFPPTHWAAENLRREGKPEASIFVAGNTGIDAVLLAAEATSTQWFPEHPGRLALLTTHRRENWGEPQRQIAQAVREITDRFPDLLLVVAMHPNPQVQETLRSVLDGHDRIRLIDAPDYERFVKLMQRATVILSDSGGVQEEAPAFGVPVFVLRDTTERPEGVTAGTAKLVGANRAAIVDEVSAVLSDDARYAAMANAVSPYGDGRAAQRIRFVILKELGIATPPEPMWT